MRLSPGDSQEAHVAHIGPLSDILQVARAVPAAGYGAAVMSFAQAIHRALVA